jgi:hypothetical protein
MLLSSVSLFIATGLMVYSLNLNDSYRKLIDRCYRMTERASILQGAG